MTVSKIALPHETEAKAKPAANSHLRWNLLFLFLIVVIITLPVWLSVVPVVNVAAMEVVFAVIIAFQFVWLIVIVCSFRRVFYLRRPPKPPSVEEGSPNFDEIRHIFAICIYKEPLDVLNCTLDSVTRQKDATSRLSMVIGLEEGTPEKDEKAKKLMATYRKKFHRFIVTVHPKGVADEIPGKCSNLNYTTRTAVSQLRADTDYHFEKYEHLITTGDCDTVFPDNYLQRLEEDYEAISDDQKHSTTWQSPLFYQMGFDAAPFFVRITGLLRSVFMMGALIPCNINPMSVFSRSLKLYEDGNYTHPGYQMEDIIALIQMALISRRVCRIRALNVATMSGPTSGKNYFNEFYEWARQIRRWSVGAAEVFHYFVIKSNRIPRTAAISWGIRFFMYYGLVLCASPIFALTAPTICQVLLHAVGGQSIFLYSDKVFFFSQLGMLALQYFWFACMFIINRLAEPAFPGGYKDETNFFFSFVHWLMSLPVIICYASIELFAFFEVAIRGKEVCRHGASKKDNLKF